MKRVTRALALLLCAAALCAVPVLAQQAAAPVAAAAGVTPDAVKALFDAYAIAIMFVWGLAQKYVPAFARWPNALIPWLNTLGYILARLAGAAIAPAAHAAGFGPQEAFAVGGVLLGGFTNAVWARQLYEGFGRALFEGLFKMRKAVPR